MTTLNWAEVNGCDDLLQEAVGDTLEELWISYNNIEKLKGINVLKKLKVLYIRVNNVKDMAEFSKLVCAAMAFKSVREGIKLSIYVFS